MNAQEAKGYGILLTILSVFSCMFMFMSLAVFIGLSAAFGPTHLAAVSYVNSTCTTVASSYEGREKCRYGNRGMFSSTFPCLKIFVEYKGNEDKIIRSLLHENEHVSTNWAAVSLTI